MNCQRALGGTQKTFSARYSSRSSGSAPFSFSSAACFSAKASEMYFRKMRPRTTCLYSAASRLPRSLSAVAQRVASKPRCPSRSEEHTSELQSQSNLVCRLLLEKKKNQHL